MIYHAKYRKKEHHMEVSEHSNDAIVVGSVNNLPEMEGLLGRPDYIIRNFGENLPSIGDSGDGHKEIKWEAPPSKEGREIRDLTRRTYLRWRQLVSEYKRSKAEAMMAIRKECTVFYPRYKHTKVKHQGTAVYYEKRTCSWQNKSAIDAYSLAPGVVLAMRITPQDNTAWTNLNNALAAKTSIFGNFTFKVKITKVYEYYRSVKVYVGRVKRRDRAKERGLREAWVKTHRPPSYMDDPFINHAVYRIRLLKYKMRHGPYHQMVACQTVSRIRGDALRKLRDAYVDAFALANGVFYPHYTFGPHGSEGWTVWGDHTEEPGVVNPYMSNGSRRHYLPSEHLVRTAPTRDCLNSMVNADGDHIDLGVYDVEVDRQRYDRAQVALSNLQVGTDEMGGFNAFRSTAELKDFAQTKDQAKKFLEWLFQHAGDISVSSGGRPYGKTTTTIRAACAAFLAWKFAVEPTAQDINTCLKNTRQHLIGARRGLWSLLQHVKCLQLGATIRKYCGWSPSGRKAQVKALYPPELEIFRSLGPAKLRYGRLVFSDEQPLINFTDRGGYEPREGDLAAFWSVIPDAAKPHWVVLPEDEKCFAHFTTEAFLESEESWLARVIEGMRLPTTVWELYPLSFVVDWFYDTLRVMNSITDTISAKWSRILSDSGCWSAGRNRLYLTYPIYSTIDATRLMAVGPSLIDAPWPSQETGVKVVDGFEDVTYYNHVRLHDVELIPTDCKSAFRGMMDAPDFLRVLTPKFRFSLDKSKVISLIAMFSSRYLPKRLRALVH